jgi:stage V sporulation protein B
MLFTFVTTLIAKVDLQILKVFTPGPPESVNLLTGDYYGAQQFATIPYQVVFSITFILFPLVSGAAGRDPVAMRTYVHDTTRYAAVLAAPIVALFAACPSRTMSLIFPSDYLSAAPSLSVLVTGYLFFALFFIMTAILTAAGRPQVSLVLGTMVAAVQIGLAFLLVAGLGRTGVALATLSAMAAGCILADITIRKAFGAGLQWDLFLRTVSCAGIAGLVSNLLLERPSVIGSGPLGGIGGSGVLSKVITVAVFGLAGVAYVVLLRLSGVLGAEDTARLRRILPGRAHP